jgi:hypothetical protein
VIENPSILQFRRLAQSSPWRWTSVEFTRSPDRFDTGVHAWIRRPGAMRVEENGGRVVVHKARRPFDGAMATRNDGRLLPVQGRWPSTVVPIYDADGLVESVPPETHGPSVEWDDPMFDDYLWVAMLNPVELARSAHDTTSGPTVDLANVAVVTHHGRTAWEAVATPTAAYDPRCDCCPMLAGEFVDDEWIPGPPSTVRLDVRTGICVYLETEGSARDLDILNVDTAMPDALFEKSISEKSSHA